MRILVLVFLLSLARAVIISRTLSMLAKCLATKLHPSSKLLSSSWTPPEPLSQTPGLLDTVFQVVLIGTKSDSVSPLVTSIFSSVGAVLKFEVALVSYLLTHRILSFPPLYPLPCLSWCFPNQPQRLCQNLQNCSEQRRLPSSYNILCYQYQVTTLVLSRSPQRPQSRDHVSSTLDSPMMPGI